MPIYGTREIKDNTAAAMAKLGTRARPDPPTEVEKARVQETFDDFFEATYSEATPDNPFATNSQGSCRTGALVV